MARMESRSAFHGTLDPLLLKRAQRGDSAALASVYERYHRACYNLALRALGEPAAAEDVVHDVFVKLVPAIRQFRGDAPFGAWLRRLVANATVDELRRRQWFDLDEPPELAASPALAGVPDAQVEAWHALMRLPPRARTILVLHEVEGWTHKELAELFGQSESYSKSILARSIHRLQSVLNGRDHGDDDDENDDERASPRTGHA
jgi:RNA polymerase sigma-70 factor (ECF subfamily)